jgi:Leucine-rich repeat (LRR) protein
MAITPEGSISPEIGKLTRLTFLEIASPRDEKMLIGEIPSTIGRLTLLELLDLSGHALSKAPQELGLLTRLTELRLNNNLFTTGPSNISSLTALVHLDTAKNNLNTSLPTGFAKLTRLTFLGLNNNPYAPGPVPEEIFGLPALKTLFLHKANRNGSLPTSIARATALTTLRLEDNQLVGTVPTELGRLTNLTVLSLRNCRINGTLPSEIGNMRELVSFSFANNSLTGTIPNSVAQLKNLTAVDLASNKLTGTIPVFTQRLLFLNVSSEEASFALFFLLTSPLTDNLLSGAPNITLSVNFFACNVAGNCFSVRFCDLLCGFSHCFSLELFAGAKHVLMHHDVVSCANSLSDIVYDICLSGDSRIHHNRFSKHDRVDNHRNHWQNPNDRVYKRHKLWSGVMDDWGDRWRRFACSGDCWSVGLCDDATSTREERRASRFAAKRILTDCDSQRLRRGSG